MYQMIKVNLKLTWGGVLTNLIKRLTYNNLTKQSTQLHDFALK